MMNSNLRVRLNGSFLIFDEMIIASSMIEVMMSYIGC